jgi:16S rRNA (guanine1207-N2)-methyltransferase
MIRAADHYRSAVMAPPASSSHYFDPEPSSGSEVSSIELVLPDLALTLSTDRGVFARDRVDTGTKLLLLDGPEPEPDDQVLVDLGAGYGPIACTLAARNPQAVVWAVEVNARARELCAANARAAGLANVRVVGPADVPDELAVDRIWSNPPIRIGKPALHELLTAWLGRLRAAGSAHLVVQKHLGADSLHRWLSEAGWVVDRRGSRKGFRLLDVARGNPESGS